MNLEIPTIRISLKIPNTQQTMILYPISVHPLSKIRARLQFCLNLRGGGAFYGKDPTKVDRSAAYICRQMAKSVVKSGLCKRALVQLSYAIGVAKPLSLFVETYGTEQGALTSSDITNIIKINFDCRPGAIAVSLALREPKYQESAAYCHFGRQPVTKNGIKFFEWENAKDLAKYKGMNSSQVEAELKSSNYLTKWVD